MDSSRGITDLSTIGFNSEGGPGRRINMGRRSEAGITSPGAVPLGFSSTAAPSGTMACLKLHSAMEMPLRLK